jgi:glycosyltransferase involved in cell wall biosynthesis
MAAGAPVLTSNVSSLPEVGGDATAYADPYDTLDIARQLESLLREPARCEELSTRGRERAQEFSWARFAELVLSTLQNSASS